MNDEMAALPAERDAALDQALAAVQSDVPTAAEEHAAARRVEATLRDAASSIITDYEALIADYIGNRLAAAQRQLFEEELRASPKLRRALAAHRDCARSTQPKPLARRDRPRAIPARPVWVWALAATVLLAVAALVSIPRLPLFEQADVARVDALDGALYRVAAAGLAPLSVGDSISGQERLRTGARGSAVLGLQDGSRVEVGARSQVALRRTLAGNRLRIDHGRVLVQATGADLAVATKELRIAVQPAQANARIAFASVAAAAASCAETAAQAPEETVFGVSRGTGGSRVAVVEGEIEVRAAGGSTNLVAGEQFDSRGETQTSAEDQVAWSRDAKLHIETLRRYATLRREIGALMTAAPRHSTRLLDLVPADAIAYLAVPNAPAKIAEAYPLLRRHDFARGYQGLMEKLGALAERLGEETVLAAVRDGDAHVPLFLAEAARPGLAALLAEQLDGQAHIAIVAEPSEAAPGVLSVWIAEDLLAASTAPTVLAEVARHHAGEQSAFANTKLYARLEEAYERGARYLFGADPILGSAGEGIGFETILGEMHQADGRTLATVDARFLHGPPPALAWLDGPGPMGALGFFSPGSQLASGIVVDTMAAAEEGFAEAPPELLEVAAALSGEFAWGFDGAALPVPAWLVVAEVYDAGAVQEAIEAIDAEDLRIATHEDAAFGTLYELAGTVPAVYAYTDGYLVAAPNRTRLAEAKRTYDSGVGLGGSRAFKDLLPMDAHLDFSAFAYANLGDAAVLLANLGLSARMGDAERDLLQQLLADVGPALYGVYREPTGLRFVANGPTGLSLPELAILAELGANALERMSGT